MNICLILCFIATVVRPSFEFSLVDLVTNVVSPFFEQCDSRWVPRNIFGLEDDLYTYVFGQDLALDVILSALQSHLSKTYHKKPLVFNFHGWPGGGKGYVADFIVDNWYREGKKSKYVKTYNSKRDFPENNELKVYEYQRMLQKDLEETISKCPRAMFVFDEVDKYPPNVLDGIKPYLDYNTDINGYDYREAIFIFITNTGQHLITDIAFQKRASGVPREELKLRDFEGSLRTLSYNDEGGFYKSDLLKHHLIDYIVPFLPLERSHVLACIQSEFTRRGGTSDELLQQAIREIMEEVSFWPSDEPLYSIHGCKHLDEKVCVFMEREKRYSRRKKNEL